MVRAVIIDNDETSVQFLRERLLNVEIVQVYRSNDFLLESLEKLQPEVIFMNIHDTTCIHIELIQYIANHKLLAHLVFIKENDTRQSFVHDEAVKYIVKPYTEDQLNYLMGQIEKDIFHRHYPNVEVCLFKYFHIKKDGNKLFNIKWRTAKARELLVYLIQHHGEFVRKDVLVELLWPDTSMDKAYDNLYATIYYIRKLLYELNIGIHINTSVHGYEVEFHNVTCDAFEFEALYEEITADLAGTTDMGLIFEKFRRLKRLYIGEYLEEESYVWKEHLREKCRIQFLSIARQVIQYSTEQGQLTDAMLLALDMQQLYPYIDYTYFVLMKLYSDYGDIENVERQYMKLKQMLHDEFNMEPNYVIKNWYQGWVQKQYS